MKVFIFTLMFLLGCFLQSGLAQVDLVQGDLAQGDLAQGDLVKIVQSDNDITHTAESFFSVSIDPLALSNSSDSQFIADMQAGWKEGYFMQRIGIEVPTLMFDYDASLIVPIEESGMSPYFGAGANIINFIVTAIGFDAHAGIEFKLDKVAIFSEYETTVVLGGNTLQNFKLGLNFYH